MAEPIPAPALLELDSRRRVTLGRLGQFDRYLVTELKGGRLLFEPAVVVTQTELDLLQDEAFRQRVTKALDGPFEPLPPDIQADLDDLA